MSAPEFILAAGGSVTGPILSPKCSACADCVRLSFPICLAPALSIVWRGQEAMPLDLSISNTALARNGWNCSSRSHRA